MNITGPNNSPWDYNIPNLDDDLVELSSLDYLPFLLEYTAEYAPIAEEIRKFHELLGYPEGTVGSLIDQDKSSDDGRASPDFTDKWVEVIYSWKGDTVFPCVDGYLYNARSVPNNINKIRLYAGYGSESVRNWILNNFRFIEASLPEPYYEYYYKYNNLYWSKNVEKNTITLNIEPSNKDNPVPEPTVTPTKTRKYNKIRTDCDICPTPTNSVTPSISVTQSITPTTTPSISLTKTVTVSHTKTPSNTISLTPSVSHTITPNLTNTPTPTTTPTISITSSNTPTKNLTQTPTNSRTSTPSISVTKSLTPTPTLSLSISPGFTPAPSRTVTTPTPTPTSVCDCRLTLYGEGMPPIGDGVGNIVCDPTVLNPLNIKEIYGDLTNAFLSCDGEAFYIPFIWFKNTDNTYGYDYTGQIEKIPIDNINNSTWKQLAYDENHIYLLNNDGEIYIFNPTLEKNTNVIPAKLYLSSRDLGIPKIIHIASNETRLAAVILEDGSSQIIEYSYNKPTNIKTSPVIFKTINHGYFLCGIDIYDRAWVADSLFSDKWKLLPNENLNKNIVYIHGGEGYYVLINQNQELLLSYYSANTSILNDKDKWVYASCGEGGSCNKNAVGGFIWAINTKGELWNFDTNGKAKKIDNATNWYKVHGSHRVHAIKIDCGPLTPLPTRTTTPSPTPTNSIPPTITKTPTQTQTPTITPSNKCIEPSPINKTINESSTTSMNLSGTYYLFSDGTFSKNINAGVGFSASSINGLSVLLTVLANSSFDDFGSIADLSFKNNTPCSSVTRLTTPASTVVSFVPKGDGTFVIPVPYTATSETQCGTPTNINAQLMFTFNCSPTPTCVPCSSTNWVEIGEIAWARDLAMSSDGMIVYTLDRQVPGIIKLNKSINGGLSWIDITANLGGYSDMNGLGNIRCSNDGNIIILTGQNAGSGGLVLARSSNGGSSWDIKSRCSSGLCSSLLKIAMSGDGKILIGYSYSTLFGRAEGLPVYVYISENYGASWALKYIIPSPGDGDLLIADVCISDDGSVMGVSCYRGNNMRGDFVFVSTNKGQSWTQTALPRVPYGVIECSGDGNTIVVFASRIGLYISRDKGQTWTLTSAPSLYYSDIAVSFDGTKIVAVTYPNDKIYCSNDNGISWIATESPRSWDKVVSSHDGSRIIASLVAPASDGMLYLSTCENFPISPTPTRTPTRTLTPTKTPVINITPTRTPIINITPTPSSTTSKINADDYVICFTDECDPVYVKSADGSVGDNWIEDSNYWNNNMGRYDANKFTMFHVSTSVGATGSWTYLPSGSSKVWPSVSSVAPYNKTPIPITLTKRPDSPEFSHYDLFLFLKYTFETKYGNSIWNTLALNKNRILVFIDTSGSMNRDTIGIAMDLFYQFLDSYCILWKEYGCNNERWIKWLVDAALNVVNCILNKESSNTISCTKLPLSNTPTRSRTPTKTPTASITPTKSLTPTRTPTRNSPTPTKSVTPTKSLTPTRTPSRSKP